MKKRKSLSLPDTGAVETFIERSYDMRLKEERERMEQVKKDADAFIEKIDEEIARRSEWNEKYNKEVEGHPMIGAGGGGVPGFDKDDPAL